MRRRKERHLTVIYTFEVCSTMSDPRFPVHVRIIGVMKKNKDKKYMTSVQWSDQCELIVYRSLGEFRMLHRQLKKKFPVDNPFSTEEGLLPSFWAQTRKPLFPKKAVDKSTSRLKNLEKYCSSLLQCNTTTSQSKEVIRFFLPTEQELLPDYTQNSVMILHPDNISTSSGGPEMCNKSLGSVTQPFVSKTYRCIASYETKDTKNKPFKVAMDEEVDVLIKDKAGWWLVENVDKRIAWFPAPYLELCDEEEDEDEFDSLTFETSLYCASRTYSSKKEDELSLTIGAVVEVLQKTDSGWWLIRYNNKAGYVPSMYLKLYNSPRFTLQSLQNKLHKSTINLCSNKSDQQLIRRSSVPKSNSLEILCDPGSQFRESGSFSDEGAEFSLSASDSSSRSPSLSSSEEEEGLRYLKRGDSGLSSGESSPISSTHALKAKRLPVVPPRPLTREILQRCTTYTRKAALATSARLTPDRHVKIEEGRA
ncbi:hypothetical protein DNTS_009934 [Danionella cerebrum]|uniref:NADPH oxidase organizer 1 n=1 Tax=Danionella cerebrum TaxID=2873325 RepID=A0A553Q262_9TELE|nr:hypothetical protein DNTS_009934 [Danionella translucida]